jgi:hypothetical protein
MRKIHSHLINVVVIVTAILSGNLIFQIENPVFAQERYREDPRLRKARARDALLNAMRLNAAVEVMLRQGSDNTGKMLKMLSESYGWQVKSIGQIEGVVREASFKDPTMERGIKDMYDIGKPCTQGAEGDIKNGDYDHALGLLAQAKLAHQRFLVLTY